MVLPLAQDMNNRFARLGGNKEMISDATVRRQSVNELYDVSLERIVHKSGNDLAGREVSMTMGRSVRLVLPSDFSFA